MKYLFLVWVLFIGMKLDGQVIFQIERFNEDKPEKYYAGSIIEYKSKAFPEEWVKSKIIEIKDEEQMIITEDDFILLSDIIMLRKPRPTMKYISYSLLTFGTTWTTFGLIAYVKDGYELGWDTAAIAGFSFLGAFVFRQFYYKKTVVNERNRLRIIDISWPEIKPGKL